MAGILITGASTGIGRALAIKLLCEGHTVWGVARNENNLKQLSDEVLNSKFFYSVADVGNTDDLELLKTKMQTQKFIPEILVLNAGITSTSAYTNQRTNYQGVVNTWQVFKGDIQKSRGVVAISGSLFALVPAVFNLSYSQSKLDALNFIKQLAGEKENQGIRFKYFVLGPVNTKAAEVLPAWKSLIIPSPQKTAAYIIQHLGSPGLINIFPLSSHIIILLNKMLPEAVMNWLMGRLKR